MSNSGGMSESALSPAVSKAVKTLACALCRTKATEEADGTCEGRTREDLRALLVGLSSAWGDKRPTKNQVDAMVGHVVKHVDAQLRLDEQQPPAGAGTATGAGAPPAGKPAPLYQWGTPSNPSEARAFDRSATEKLTSKKTCVAPPLAPHAASPLAPHAANRPAAHPHLLPGGSSEACLFFSLTPTPAVMGSQEECIKAKLAERVGEARVPLELKLEELLGFIGTGVELLGAIYAPSQVRCHAPSRDRHLPSHPHPPRAALDTASPRRCALTRPNPRRRGLPTRRPPSRTGARVP